MIENLMREMKADILKVPHSTLYKGKAKHPKANGFWGVPAIRSMKIELKSHNALLEMVGLKRRLPPKISFKDMSSKKMNRYIWHQTERARRSITNPKLFWTIAKYCIKKSVSFRTAAYNNVFPGWWHSESLKEVANKLRRIEKIIKEDRTDLQFFRVYIEKGTTYRPLGVPAGEWRVVMNMYSKFLTLFVKDQLWYNHAYQPGKGTMTAWIEIIKKVLPAQHIYEFDLKQFFPSVNINNVTRCLKELKVPDEIANWLEEINRRYPHLPAEEKLDERRTKKRIELEEGIKMGSLPIESEFMTPVREMGEELSKELATADGYDSLFKWLLAQREELKKYNIISDEDKELPQGLNTSPILSILTMKDWCTQLAKKGIGITLYADDGIMYSDEPFEPIAMKDIPFNLEKSGWVKRYDAWEKDLKFLGILYRWKEGMIEGSTRNGSTLRFSDRTKRVFELLRMLKSKGYPETPLKDLAESNIMGFVQSKLYGGSWGKPKEEQKEWKTRVDSWWGTKGEIRGNPTKSSEACEWLAGQANYSITKQRSSGSKHKYANLTRKIRGTSNQGYDHLEARRERRKHSAWKKKW